MRLKPLHIFLILLAAFAAGCSGNRDKFTVIGEVRNFPDGKVVLEELGINEITVIDSSKTDGDGKFELSGIAPEPGMYRISFPGNQYIMLSIDKGNLKVNADYNQLHEYDVTGSASSASLRSFLRTVRGYVKDINTLGEVARVKKQMGDDSTSGKADRDMKEVNFQLTQFIEHYADTTLYLPNAIFAVRILNPATEYAFLETFSQTLDRRFPNAQLAKDYNAMLARMMDKNPESLGNAPDFSLPTPAGEMVSLSSFRGKYVLVDFWASWCGPCRRENPNVVAAYNKFKDRNFTILGVSLDSKQDAWEGAIKDDRLSWTHVSDLKGWESSAARLYQVDGIPMNFLVDPKGRIIANNLRGEELEAMLERVLP